MVTAADGWQVSYTNTADGEWSDTLTRSNETGNTSDTLTFYVKNKEHGYISEAITETYKIDKTAPTGEISIDEANKWADFVNPVNFNLFYKDAQSVALIAKDAGSDIKTIEYLAREDDLTIEQLQDKTFTTYANAFDVNPDAKFIVYAKLTDNAGNVTYLRSDGIVLDATAPLIEGAENGKTYCAAVTLNITDEYLDTVTLNGENVEIVNSEQAVAAENTNTAALSSSTATMTDGKLTLGPAEGAQTVVATDKAGNSSNITVTVNESHTWGAWTPAGDGVHHMRVCQIDSDHEEIEECHGGVATCVAKAVCEVCGAQYGSIDENNHANLKHVEYVAATADAQGNIEYWYCEDCDKYFRDAEATEEISQQDTIIEKVSESTTSEDSQDGASTVQAKASTTSAQAKDNTPSAGDSNSLVVYMMLLVLGAAGVGVLSLAVYRRKNSKK